MGLMPGPRRLKTEKVYADDNDSNDPIPDALHGIVRNHVASFDYFVEHGLSEVVERLDAVAIQPPGTSAPSSRLSLWFEEVCIGRPSRESDGSARARDPRVFPRECREASITYKGPMTAAVCWSMGENGYVCRREFRVCMFPVMVRSSACHLAGASCAELIGRGEEVHEMGGYFILNGNERIIRLLIQQRRHYIM